LPFLFNYFICLIISPCKLQLDHPISSRPTPPVVRPTIVHHHPSSDSFSLYISFLNLDSHAFVLWAVTFGVIF
jgi:hypothetical protein